MVVQVIGRDGEGRPLHLHLNFCNHSPTGYDWGYGGSGPAQLAFEILYDVFADPELAWTLHQRFKFDRIATLSRDAPWNIREGEVVQWAAQVEVEDDE
jgi:hypothetical protein